MKLRRIEADSPELEQFIEGTYTDQKQFDDVRYRLALFGAVLRFPWFSFGYLHF
jgi:hypothetical protein